MSAIPLEIDVVGALRDAGLPHAVGGGTPEGAELTAGFNLGVRHRPAAVGDARSAGDVVTAVRVAGALGTCVVPIGLGHGTPFPLERGVAVTTRRLAAVEVDPVAGTARVGAGTAWSDVLAATAPHGLAPLAGSAPHVGVVGYLLGGGLGPVARTYGFAADHVRSFTVVTGDAELLTVDADRHADLFWALRGGKHGLGVVVEAEIELVPLAELYGGGLFFDASHARAVLDAFHTWTAGVPETVSASAAILRLPPLPQLPEPLRGRTVVHVRVAVVGDGESAGEVVAPLRSAAPVLLDLLGPMPYAALGAIHADPVDPMPVHDGGILLGALDREAFDVLVALADPAAALPVAAIELRLLGGALAREPRVPNAVGGRDAAWLLHVVGAPVPEPARPTMEAVVGGVLDGFGAWATGGVQANFVGAANRPGAWSGAWSPETVQRLAAVRAAYDPRGVLAR